MLENEVWAGIPLGGKICAGISLFCGIFPLVMLLGGSFGPVKIGLSGVGESRGGEGLEEKFGQGLFCMEDFLYEDWFW